MKIVLSPAKSLDYSTEVPSQKQTKALFLEQSKQLMEKLREESPAALSKMMKISDKIANLNYERNQEWKVPMPEENARQALFAFKGDVYVGLDAYSLEEKQLEWLQGSLRILSGLYGYLRPLDNMLPYRLEMGTKFPVGEAKNLYGFWGTRLTDAINAELKEEELFVNLASNEYYKVLQEKNIQGKVVTPIFKDYKNGVLKVISFYAKKARGSMVRYLVDNEVDSMEGIKGFNYDGYALDASLSEGNTLVFTR